MTQCGSNPVIVEVERETLGLDIKQLKKAIKKFKPKVIQIVHVYGCPAKHTIEIKNLCKNKIYLLEDFSEALGSKIKNKMIGTPFGDISISSIRSEKMIGVGEGGVVLCNNSKGLRKIKEYIKKFSWGKN